MGWSPRPAFICSASDEKLSGGLGTRLCSYTTSPGADHCKRYRVGQNPLDAAEGSVQRCEVPISPPFHLHFSVIRIGSRGTFVLCTASSRCKRIAGPAAAMCFFLGQISLAQHIVPRPAHLFNRSDEKPGGAYSL